MSKKSNDVVITAALRTPIGTYKGSLKGLSADKLGSIAIKEAVYKSKLKSGCIQVPRHGPTQKYFVDHTGTNTPYPNPCTVGLIISIILYILYLWPLGPLLIIKNLLFLLHYY